VVIQGFGAVGTHAARFLADQGCLVVAVSDSRGAISNDKGLRVDQLIEHKGDGGSVADFSGGERIEPDELIGVDCEIWIPAARPDVIHDGNVGALRARLVVPGANIPITPSAERTLHERGVVYIPDFIANAGGVICAAMEYRSATRTAAFDAIAERIRENTETVLRRSQDDGVLPGVAARDLASERVRAAMALRRFSIF
jgi:glutamate dehydrogenase (NAD(P)+)